MDGIDFLQERERFIPYRLSLLLERILRDERLSDEEREGVKSLFTMIQARFHFEFHQQLEMLKAAYAPFDPDSEMRCDEELTEEELDARRDRLFVGFDQLLAHGNYVELTREQLAECLNLQPLAGLAVDVELDDFREMRVYYRGVSEHVEKKRLLFLPWPCWETPVYQFGRVALLARTQDDSVILKLFKNIILPDLKIISPCLRIRMPMFARLKIGSTVLGGLAAPLWKLLVAAAMHPVLLGVILVGCVGAFIKGIGSFLSCRTKYMQTLSSSLYYQSLANNESVLTRLVDTAEAEEVKEMLLAYYMLYVRRDTNFTDTELDLAIEKWLMDQFGRDIDFEVDDGVRKLREKDLLVVRTEMDPATGEPREILKVYDITTSLRRMDEMWDNIFTHANEGCATQDRLADGDWPVHVVRDPATRRADPSHETPGAPHAAETDIAEPSILKDEREG